MKSRHFIPIAVLALAMACTENASNPAENGGPELGAGGSTGSPKYASSTYSLTNSLGLNHSWRQTGLGSFTNVPYSLSASADITAHCENKPGNTVNGTPFHVSQPLSADGSFPQRNGAINGSLTLTPGSVACQPPGGNPHDAIIDAVVYSSIRFCWGKASPTVADIQGPVPGGPGNGGTVPPSPQSGTPLTGTESGSSGIFAACSST
jgi:hypothetical protein